MSERDNNREVYTVCPDGSATVRRTHNAAADHVVTVAPDGRLTLLVTHGRAGEPGYSEQIAVLGASAARVLASSRRMRNPSWFADARSLAVEADLDGFSDIFRVPADGGKPIPLTRDAAGSFEPAVSPDGQLIAFVSSREGDAEVFTMKPDGSELLRLTHSIGDDSSPAWSPDGKLLAFVSGRRGAARVFLMSPDGSKPRALVDDHDDSVVAEKELAWSPDNCCVAYIALRRAEPRAASRNTASLRIVRTRDGQLLAKHEGAFRDETPAWSPDGRFVVFASDRDGDVELYRMPSTGGAPVRITHSPGLDFLPRWLALSPR